jgi:hypothetical protein
MCSFLGAGNDETLLALGRRLTPPRSWLERSDFVHGPRPPTCCAAQVSSYGWTGLGAPQRAPTSERACRFREADLACKVCHVDFCGESILEMVGNPLQAP